MKRFLLFFILISSLFVQRLMSNSHAACRRIELRATYSFGIVPVDHLKHR